MTLIFLDFIFNFFHENFEEFFLDRASKRFQNHQNKERVYLRVEHLHRVSVQTQLFESVITKGDSRKKARFWINLRVSKHNSASNKLSKPSNWCKRQWTGSNSVQHRAHAWEYLWKLKNRSNRATSMEQSYKAKLRLASVELGNIKIQRIYTRALNYIKWRMFHQKFPLE